MHSVPEASGPGNKIEALLTDRVGGTERVRLCTLRQLAVELRTLSAENLTTHAAVSLPNAQPKPLAAVGACTLNCILYGPVVVTSQGLRVCT